MSERCGCCGRPGSGMRPHPPRTEEERLAVARADRALTSLEYRAAGGPSGWAGRRARRDASAEERAYAYLKLTRNR